MRYGYFYAKLLLRENPSNLDVMYPQLHSNLYETRLIQSDASEIEHIFELTELNLSSIILREKE